MKIAVTGASGFVGGAIATALAADGHDVVGFGRTSNGWSHNRGTYRQWDITSGPLAPIESGGGSGGACDAVVHAGALADDWAPLARAMAVNRFGTRAVTQSFAGARFVHISTSSVYDAFTPTVRASESTPLPIRWLNSYSQSKAAAEAEVPSGAITLRPHAVYGPGDTTLLPRLLASVRHGRLVLPAGGAVLHTLTHIDNLVLAVRLALEPHAPAGVFNIGDAEPVLLRDLLKHLLERRGLDIRVTGIPYALAFQLAGASEVAARLTGRTPRLTRYAVSQLGLERTLDLSAARDRLGYRPEPTCLDGAENW